MLVLAIDTAGSTGGVLLARNRSDLSEPGEIGLSDLGETEVLGASLLEPRQFSRQLISAVAELLQADKFTLTDVDTFAIITGPGSFTGLRVGLSAVKAMAEVTAKPIIALSRLAIMASMAEVCCPAKPAGLVHAVLDAGRGEFYHGIYRDAGRTCLAESFQTLGSLATGLKSDPGWVVASELIVLDTLRALPGIEPSGIPSVTIREALPLVFAAWQSRRFTDVALLDANYLRRMGPEIACKSIAAKPVDAPL